MWNATIPEFYLDADALSRRPANQNTWMQLRIPQTRRRTRCAARAFRAPVRAHTLAITSRESADLIVDEQRRMGGAGVIEQPFSGFAQLGSRWTAGTQGAEQPTAADLTRNQIHRSPNRTRAPDGAPRPSCGSRSRSSPHGTADGAITCSTRAKHPTTQAKKCSRNSPQVAEHHRQRVPPSPRQRECPEVHLNRTGVPVRLSKSSFGATGT